MRETAAYATSEPGNVALREYIPLRVPLLPAGWLAGGGQFADSAPPPGGGGAADARGSRAQQPGPGDATGPILVVDDDRSILATVHDILEIEGYPVIAVPDGAEALRLAAAMQPSLVLLDMRMPGLNGWEVARRLREDGIAAPILVMTAARDARLWAEQIGADGYLAKPFDLDELLSAVERLWPA